MQPQGANIINQSYFAAVTARLNASSSCAELQAAVTETLGSIQAAKDAMQAQIDAFTPMLPLLVPLTGGLGEVQTFIGLLISAYLTPQFQPAIVLAEKLSLQIEEISALESAVASIAARFPSCSITFPT